MTVKKPKTDRTCSRCRNPVSADGKRRKYCSPQCMHVANIDRIKMNREKGRAPFITKKCMEAGCDKSFTTNLPGKKYCGPECAAVGRMKFPGGKHDA